MTKENLEPLNAQAATEHAQEANELAFSARIVRDAKYELELIIEAWTTLFKNGSVLVFIILFFLAIIVEVNFSFAMYEDIAQSAGQNNDLMAYFAAFFVVYLGALVSHYIAKMVSRSMFNYAVTNLIRSRNGDIPYNAAKEQMEKLKRKDFIIGIFLGVIVIIVVTLVSFQRLKLLGVIYHRDYDQIHRYLPVFAVIVEMYTGIYLAYFWNRTYSQIKLFNYKRRFKKLKKACVELTKLAVTYYEYAMTHNEYISLSKDLLDALYRWKHRSVDSELYVDAVEGIKTLSVTVMDGKYPAVNVHLTGLLKNNGNCTSIYTNEMGEGVLTWIDDVNEVLLMTADGDVFKGPWRANSSTTIHLRKLRRIKAA